MDIQAIQAREILDSRGTPTVEVDVTAGDTTGRASVPSGASTGSNEAVEVRDGGERYHGNGVRQAVANVKEHIAPALTGTRVSDQREIDETLNELDGTERKERLGANAILGVSLACARTAASAGDTPLHKYLSSLADTDEGTPTPFMNVINGGEHADNALDVQEHHVVPRADSFAEQLRIGAEVYHELGTLLHDRGYRTGVGDEGGYAPGFDDVREPFDVIWDAVEALGYEDEVDMALDVAATELYTNGSYHFYGDTYTGDELRSVYGELCEEYPIVMIEDPFEEDAYDAFATLRGDVDVNVVGDDLLCTNPDRIGHAIEHGSCDTLLLKVNQIGTVMEALDAARLAMRHGWDVIVSHRSGDTVDAFISDLAVALNAWGVKAGAPCRGERTAKYNQLLRLEAS